MITEAEGIILRQTKITGGRRMMVILTDRFGKISAGSFIREKNRGKNALAIRPFTHGLYELYRKGDFFSINSAQTIRSYYRIGENVECFLDASFCLELTDRVLAENVPAGGVFRDLSDFLSAMDKRKKKFMTLVLAYEIKILRKLGYMPDLSSCVECGRKDGKIFFSIEKGGIICADCLKKQGRHPKDRLIYDIDFGIVNVVNFLERTPFSKLEKLAANDELTASIEEIMRNYIKYHFDISSFKSEGMKW